MKKFNLVQRFGPSFVDNFKPLNQGLTLDHPSDSQRSPVRWMWVSLVLGLGILFSRLFYLQVVQGQKNWQLANDNRIRLSHLPAPRGIIYDRRGYQLVRNTPIFRVKITQANSAPVIRPLTRDAALKFEIEGPESLGISTDQQVELSEAVGREYLSGKSSAHLLGYLGEVSPQEISTHRSSPADCSQLELGDLIGRSGIEQQYDCWLRGKPGAELKEVDTRGSQLKSLGKRLPVPGHNLILTIDQQLQQISFDALEQKPGAVIASNPLTGEILALVSSPGFDPNIFVSGYSSDQTTHQDQILKLLNHPSRPLFNRAITGVYAPGSTFKLITAAAGLQLGAITPDWLYQDTGVETLGSYTYTNWYFTQHGGKEGFINITRALARSTDTFFYRLGGLIGVDDLADFAHQFGLGKKTGIDLPGEAAGLVPDPAWKLETKGERWYLGNTYHLAIGQADLLTTPLQVNQITGAIAAGGQWCRPHLVDFAASQLIPSSPFPHCRSLEISPEVVNIIAQGMRQACSAGGTAFPFFDFSIPVACKTGTAQAPGDTTHAWLTLFAPYLEETSSASLEETSSASLEETSSASLEETSSASLEETSSASLEETSSASLEETSSASLEETSSASPDSQHLPDKSSEDLSSYPPIALTVLLEKGGSGSYDAAPLAREILEEWYRQK